MAAAGPSAPSPLTYAWVALLLLVSGLLPSSYASSLNIVDSSYPAIFVFGDSLSDTGNAVLAKQSSALRASQLPYGETFPGWPTSRLNDGHVLVDLLASHFGLPLLNPYLNSSADFEKGVNYAVAGATAHNVSFLETLNVYPHTNYSLDVQLSWHLGLQAKAELSKGKLGGGLPTGTAFSEALYVIEIGGNDHIFTYLANYPPSFVISSLIPSIMQEIHDAVETLLDTGAKHFLFFTISPLGCLPAILSWADGVKDANGCLEEYNAASYLHAEMLKEEVASLQTSYPNASFLLMDFYGAYEYVLNQKETFGFVEGLQACCGAGEDYAYNYNPNDKCNVESVALCADPNKYVVWDGDHFTDRFNLQIFNQTFITGNYMDFPHAKQ